MKAKNELFYIYYENWIKTYKEGALRQVTLKKYYLSLKWVKELVPKLRTQSITRVEYQTLLNKYAELHERQTTMDFHHQLKSALLDAVEEGYIPTDTTRKVVIKGKQPKQKKIKYLNQYQLHSLLIDLELKPKINWDWLILLIAKTGIRFSEAFGLTPNDFDFSHQFININKTWDYKSDSGFSLTKNKSSIRKVQIDWQTVMQFLVY